MSSSPVVLDHLILPLIEGTTVLDLGCGLGKWGALLYACWFETASHAATGAFQPARVDGLDRFLPNLKRLQGRDEYRLLTRGDAFAIPCRAGAFDTVLGVELLEHLTEAEGLLLLRDAERVARRMVIISTPHYPEKRDGGDNPYEWHRSIWTIERLRGLGYEVYGAGFEVPHPAADFPGVLPYPLWARCWWRLYRFCRDKQWGDLNAWAARRFGWFSYRRPQWSAYLIAVKRLASPAH